MTAQSPAAAPRRRLSTDERRAAILAAARTAFGDAAYAEVSTAQVAAMSGSSPGLVFHYFGSKAQLYAAAVQASIVELRARQADLLAELPARVPVRDRVRVGIEAILDHVAAHPRAWSLPLVGGEEPAEALAVRREARSAQVEILRTLLPVTEGWARHEYALAGVVGFVDQACVRWVDAGCPEDERGPLVDAALGALQGALGDWGG